MKRLAKKDGKKDSRVEIVIKAGKPKLYVNKGERINISDSGNFLKIAVAREMSRWLRAESRSWIFNGSIEINYNRLGAHVERRFGDYKWVINQSQSSYDLVSPNARLAIENKSVAVGKKKLVTNASIYGDKVRAGDTLSNFDWAKYGCTEDTELDVLVVCVDRSEDNLVYDYAIVDGCYWGVTKEDAEECHALFGELNGELREKILKLIYKETGNSFVGKLIDGVYSGVIDFKLRKLINIINPINKFKQGVR